MGKCGKRFDFVLQTVMSLSFVAIIWFLLRDVPFDAGKSVVVGVFVFISVCLGMAPIPDSAGFGGMGN